MIIFISSSILEKTSLLLKSAYSVNVCLKFWLLSDRLIKSISTLIVSRFCAAISFSCIAIGAISYLIIFPEKPTFPLLFVMVKFAMNKN